MEIEIGEESLRIMQDVDKYVANHYARLGIVPDHGDGINVWDVDGNHYFEMLCCYSALPFGHADPEIIEAFNKEVKKLSCTSNAVYPKNSGDFGKRIRQLTGLHGILPMVSGTEGAETAIKAMRKWAYDIKGVPRYEAEIIVAGSEEISNFHGRGFAAISASTSHVVREGFGPYLPGFVKIPFNDVSALEEAINDNTAGFLVEPIQGEAGVIIPDDDYLNKVRKVCTANNILLGLDEVQTGLGRTGKMFCYEYNGIRPDVLALGKALGGGIYPSSTIVGTKEVMDVFTPGTQGSTFGGNHIACGVGLKVLEIIEREGLVEDSYEMGKYLLERLKEIENPNIKDVRGRGLMTAVDLGSEELASRVAKEMAKGGIITKDAHTSIRFAPPLTVTEVEIDKAMERIEEVFSRI